MSKKVAIFWPGDYRSKPNEWALAQSRETTGQLTAALKKLGRTPYLIDDYLTRPDQAIARLGPIDDPMVGVFVHWTYAPHTVDGVVGKDNPLLLASNFSGTWPGLVALLNTGASLESVGRQASRVWTDAPDWTADTNFMERLDEWCSTGQIRYSTSELHEFGAVSPDAAATAARVLASIRQKRILALMLGDTSMGMINGYFGPRVLYKLGFSEHKVDQAWLIDRVKTVNDARVDQALRFVQEKGVVFHWNEADASDFTVQSTREQLRCYLAVLDLLDEFKADCLGWQYQLGLLKLLPPSDFAEGLLNSHARPEGNGHAVMTSTEADQGNLIPMELDEAPAGGQGTPRRGDVPRRPLGRPPRRPLSLGAAQFRKLRRLCVQPRRQEPPGRAQLPPARRLFPRARRHIHRLQPCRLDHLGKGVAGSHRRARHGVGRGESVSLPEDVRETWWRGTTRQWPFMAADLGCSMDTIMAHYMSNHIAVAYGDIFGEMLALARSLGFKVRIMSSQSVAA